MRLRWLVVLAVVGVALIGGGPGSGASTPVCSASGPDVCVDLVGTPGTVAPSGETDHYVNYVAHVSNNGSQSATHTGADLVLSGGLILTAATSSDGTCSINAHPTCTLGKLAGGADATVEFTARVPKTEGTGRATLTVNFDERANDGPSSDPKQDTVVVHEDTLVKIPDGSAATFVPEGASLTLTTAPTDSAVTTATDPLIGQAIITTSPIDTTAAIDEVSLTIPCPKKVVCRGGDWFHAEIPGTFDPPLAFPLRWDATLIPTSLNVKKFALLYTECLNGCKLQIISARCSSASPSASQLPCLSGVAKLSDGDWVATLWNDHNGWMK